MIAEYKAQTKKKLEQEQLPEPVERKQILSAKTVTNSGLKTACCPPPIYSTTSL